MKPEDNYLELNKKAWNDKTAFHTASDFYDMPGFMSGKSTLQDIELELLGNVSDKKCCTCNVILVRIPYHWQGLAQRLPV